jgi:hypothetical protein
MSCRWRFVFVLITMKEMITMCCNEGHRHHGCGCGETYCQGGECECGCGNGGFKRRYQTKAEQISELEEYLNELKAEVQAVEERLADLRK